MRARFFAAVDTPRKTGHGSFRKPCLAGFSIGGYPRSRARDISPREHGPLARTQKGERGDRLNRFREPSVRRYCRLKEPSIWLAPTRCTWTIAAFPIPARYPL